MTRLHGRIAITSMVFLCGSLAIAKRLPPIPVPPVVSGGVAYSADGDGRDEVVVATEKASGKVLWQVKVARNHIKPWVIGDADLVYLNQLKLVDNVLFVRDERSKCYSVDLPGKRVKKRRCGA
jgi:hypothetical protein